MTQGSKPFTGFISEMYFYSGTRVTPPSLLARVVGKFVPAFIKSRVQWFRGTEYSYSMTAAERSMLMRSIGKRYGIITDGAVKP